MRVLIISVIVTSTISIANIASASNHALHGQLPPMNPNTQRIISTIDGIDVPFDVLNYVQTEYIGHTVTQVRRITRNGQQAYQLRVDRDDVANDNDSFYLIYDSSWKLISGKEKVQTSPPAAPQQVKPKEQRQDSDRQEHEESDDDEAPRNRRGRD